ncbi:wd-repeat protein interacting with phosphoinosides wipi -related [Holotrichia oblita]|uniref:Wd-repeat protein interacting with phosphoinosides wipi -related n=2 Tax=Holotrichia oblita TaxID=644536 RepID=A0ACB9SN81_HOLOL|nr:wd-repeat protein interacting with phosphoinosides wipi -related [Holotrichia oblita]KAI4456791.1 wd-repeat protein interacting with phosphoinosides wipi -related [Holotrichia oblita]
MNYGVRFNLFFRQRLVVCLEESLYIHNIRDMKVLHTIRETPPNPQGLCALSIDNDNCFLAYPGSSTIGEVQIFDAINLHAKTMIPAHDSPLAAIAFSPNGTRIATASEKGTVIRVFSVSDGTKLFEFRRGVKRCVAISSLVFSMCSNYLGCSSNTETVHIFKLEEPKDRIQNQLRLLVATEDGFLYVYNMDSNEGGDLTLYKQHRLDGKIDETKTDGPPRSEPQPIQDGESEKFREMAAATESPPKGGFQFNDDQEYPRSRKNPTEAWRRPCVWATP